MKFKNSLLKLTTILLLALIFIAAVYFVLDDVIWIVSEIVGLFLPFIAAYIVSGVVNPLVDKLEKCLKIPRNISSIVVILFTVGTIGSIIFAIGWKIIEEIRSLYEHMPELMRNLEDIWGNLSVNFSNIYSSLPDGVQQVGVELGNDIVKYTSEFIKNSSLPIFLGIGNFAKALPDVFIWTVVFILSLYFMVTDSESIKKIVEKKFSERFLWGMKRVRREIKKHLGGYVKAQLIIMSIVSIIIWIGLSVLNIPYSLLLAIAIAFLDALPLFGSGAILWPWSAVSFVNSDVHCGVGLIIIYLLIVCVRQIVEPKLVSENIGIYPLFTLMSMYLGFRLFSLGGIISGPIILIIAVSFYKAGIFNGPIKFAKKVLAGLWKEIKAMGSYFTL